MKHIVYLGIGSNIGNRCDNILKALRYLKDYGYEITKTARFYKTRSLGGPSGQGDFINTAIKVETLKSPYKVLQDIQEIENKLGRRRNIHWGPRSIDIDILFYDDKIIDTKKLKIPHPRICERDFVLKPLNEIAPNLIHPQLNENIKTIKEKLSMRVIKIIKTIKGMRKVVKEFRQQGKRIGFVPTMGALHEGHLSLIRYARKENDIVIISIFVNPLQFGPAEDYKKYPRDIEHDKRLARSVGVNIIFYPAIKEMYDVRFQTYIDQYYLPKHLCGLHREGHFKGVMTVCMKLFNIVQPDIAYFGQKDYQQFKIIERMVKDLNIPMKLKMLPIVRESDGLAMSSRNIYLKGRKRQDASVLYKSLCLGKKLVLKNRIRNTWIIKKKLLEYIKKNVPDARVDYIAIIDPETLDNLKTIKKKVVFALAIRLRNVRLIDNFIIYTNLT